MNDSPRHPGPSINKILWSERLMHQVAAKFKAACFRAWDDLCDADPDLVPWFWATLEQRRGNVMWKLDDHVGPPKTRKTKTGDLTVYISVDDVIGEHLEPVLQRLILWTLTMRAELDGVEPPPTAVTSWTD